MDKMEEIVWAVKVNELSPDDTLFEGYQVPPDPTILDKIYNNCVAMSRRDCENNPEFKHVIPYVMITSEDNQIFVMRRTTSQTEGRLHGKASIGVGGHVGPGRYVTIKDSIHTGMLRELQEEVTGMDEVGTSFDFLPSLMGFVNDDSNSVGQVHLGMVFELLVDPDRIPTIDVKETENMIGSWFSFKEALEVENYESWSALILGLI